MIILLIFFNTAGYAQYHDDKGDNQSHGLPEIIAEGSGHGAKSKGKAVHIAGSQCSAGQGTGAVAKDPAHDDRVSDSQGKGAQNRDISDGFSQTPSFSPAGHGLAKGAYRAGAGGAAECHFPDNARKAYHNDKEEIGKQKGAAAVFGDSGGKHPYIAHSNGGTDAGQDKSPNLFSRNPFECQLS